MIFHKRYLSILSIGFSGNAHIRFFIICICMVFPLSFLFTGCSTPPKKLMIEDIQRGFYPESIIDTKYQDPISFEMLIDRLSDIQLIYVGERHTDQNHHDLQLKVIKSLYELHPDLQVGMEMFANTYQHILDQWSDGQLDESEFLMKTHWYANWRYPFELYRDILLFIRENNISLVGLNIPFHIPSKIATGGINNLLEHDRKFLPETINTDIEAHRQYVKRIWQKHNLRGRDNFENFYEAQCVWEDTMAEVVAAYSGEKPMVILAGNGHIIYKFGIPVRAFQKNPVTFKTIYPVAAGNSVKLDYADYIWVTPETRKFHRMPPNHP